MASTYLVGLIGESIEHSLTPDLHMREARHLGLDYEYRIIDLLEPDLRNLSIDEVLAAAARSGYNAVNVTHPFKQQALPFLAATTTEVDEIGATNLVLGPGSKSTGHNTDWSGFLFALRQSIPTAENDLVLQVGAGGAGGAQGVQGGKGGDTSGGGGGRGALRAGGGRHLHRPCGREDARSEM